MKLVGMYYRNKNHSLTGGEADKTCVLTYSRETHPELTQAVNSLLVAAVLRSVREKLCSAYV